MSDGCEIMKLPHDDYNVNQIVYAILFGSLSDDSLLAFRGEIACM